MRIPLLLGLSLVSSSIAEQQQQQPLLQNPASPATTTTSYPPISTRLAKPSDGNAIADIIISAFPLDPSWDYQYRYRKQYPEIHWRCTRDAFETVLEENGKNSENNFSIYVAETLANEGDVWAGEDGRRPVAVSVWLKGRWRWGRDSQEAGEDGEGRGLAALDIFSGASMAGDCSKRPDRDAKRVAAFNQTIRAYARDHFVKRFEEKHLYLGTLATHPDYQRRGAGSMLLQYGLNVAEEESLGLSLFASPMGHPVYAAKGYNVTDVLKIQVEGEDEWVEEVAMWNDQWFED